MAAILQRKIAIKVLRHSSISTQNIRDQPNRNEVSTSVIVGPSCLRLPALVLQPRRDFSWWKWKDAIDERRAGGADLIAKEGISLASRVKRGVAVALGLPAPDHQYLVVEETSFDAPGQETLAHDTFHKPHALLDLITLFPIGFQVLADEIALEAERLLKSGEGGVFRYLDDAKTIEQIRLYDAKVRTMPEPPKTFYGLFGGCNIVQITDMGVKEIAPGLFVRTYSAVTKFPNFVTGRLNWNMIYSSQETSKLKFRFRGKGKDVSRLLGYFNEIGATHIFPSLVKRFRAQAVWGHHYRQDPKGTPSFPDWLQEKHPDLASRAFFDQMTIAANVGARYSMVLTGVFGAPVQDPPDVEGPDDGPLKPPNGPPQGPPGIKDGTPSSFMLINGSDNEPFDPSAGDPAGAGGKDELVEVYQMPFDTYASICQDPEMLLEILGQDEFLVDKKPYTEVPPGVYYGDERIGFDVFPFVQGIADFAWPEADDSAVLRAVAAVAKQTWTVGDARHAQQMAWQSLDRGVKDYSQLARPRQDGNNVGSEFLDFDLTDPALVQDSLLQRGTLASTFDALTAMENRVVEAAMVSTDVLTVIKVGKLAEEAVRQSVQHLVHECITRPAMFGEDAFLPSTQAAMALSLQLRLKAEDLLGDDEPKVRDRLDQVEADMAYMEDAFLPQELLTSAKYGALEIWQKYCQDKQKSIRSFHNRQREARLPPLSLTDAELKASQLFIDKLVVDYSAEAARYCTRMRGRPTLDPVTLQPPVVIALSEPPSRSASPLPPDQPAQPEQPAMIGQPTDDPAAADGELRALPMAPVDRATGAVVEPPIRGLPLRDPVTGQLLDPVTGRPAIDPSIVPSTGGGVPAGGSGGQGSGANGPRAGGSTAGGSVPENAENGLTAESVAPSTEEGGNTVEGTAPTNRDGGSAAEVTAPTAGADGTTAADDAAPAGDGGPTTAGDVSTSADASQPPAEPAVNPSGSASGPSEGDLPRESLLAAAPAATSETPAEPQPDSVNNVPAANQPRADGGSDNIPPRTDLEQDSSGVAGSAANLPSVPGQQPAANGSAFSASSMPPPATNSTAENPTTAPTKPIMVPSAQKIRARSPPKSPVKQTGTPVLKPPFKTP